MWTDDRYKTNYHKVYQLYQIVHGYIREILTDKHIVFLTSAFENRFFLKRYSDIFSIASLTSIILIYNYRFIFTVLQVSLERKTREAEMLTARLVEESEKRAAEANNLKEELLRARAAEKQAKEKLLDFLSRTTSYAGSNITSPISVSS